MSTTRRISMRKGLVILASLAIGFFLGTAAWGQSMTGNDYMRNKDSMREYKNFGYLNGFCDGCAVSPKIDVALFNRTVKGMTYGQVNAIVDKFLKEHPEYWHYDLADIVYNAITKTSPK
jgi:hypothetical protein